MAGFITSSQLYGNCFHPFGLILCQDKKNQCIRNECSTIAQTPISGSVCLRRFLIFYFACSGSKNYKVLAKLTKLPNIGISIRKIKINNWMTPKLHSVHGNCDHTKYVKGWNLFQMSCGQWSEQSLIQMDSVISADCPILNLFLVFLWLFAVDAIAFHTCMNAFCSWLVSSICVFIIILFLDPHMLIIWLSYTKSSRR